MQARLIPSKNRDGLAANRRWARGLPRYRKSLLTWLQASPLRVSWVPRAFSRALASIDWIECGLTRSKVRNRRTASRSFGPVPCIASNPSRQARIVRTLSIGPWPATSPDRPEASSSRWNPTSRSRATFSARSTYRLIQ